PGAAPAVVPGVAQPAGPAVAPTTVVAVIGDSIADGLATGLTEAFSDAPELAVKRYLKANAGLVRTDYHDFVAAAREAVAAGPLAYAVIDVGVNDRQPFLDARDLAPLSPGWRRLYATRIDALLAPFREKGVPVYWVGLAPSESVKASSDHIALNALARERVEAAGGVYVDVWEGFVDEEGDYAAVGPQLDGRTARLRLDDGVHFSKAGARKLAHYVEQELRKTFRPKAPADALAATPDDGGAPLAGPDRAA
ncbi:GDSL-type esterase/lipase family protein, partial [Methylopila musalis]